MRADKGVVIHLFIAEPGFVNREPEKTILNVASGWHQCISVHRTLS